MFLEWSRYQITAIANRTTLADGNTWNQEHIALLGLVLSSPPAEAHALARHLGDYVLVWLGADLGKSHHMARIANSVFRGHCYDLACEQYGTHPNGAPSAMKHSGLMWHLVGKDGACAPTAAPPTLDQATPTHTNLYTHAPRHGVFQDSSHSAVACTAAYTAASAVSVSRHYSCLDCPLARD